ncbi:MAG: hypothetical protein CL920_01050 [Deltaproteobacteria bacterium]|nr:hypothetical protein [Deltaproteobacteria bacterium]
MNTNTTPASPPAPIKWGKWLFGLFLTYVSLSLIVGLYFSHLLLYPKLPHCTKKSYYYCKTPKEQKLPFASVSFTSSDKVKLRGWWIPAPKDKPSKRVVIVVHGRGGDKRVGMRYAKAIHNAGFHLFAFDLRNSGESEKAYNSMGYHEQKDVIAAVTYAIKVKKMQNIGVFAFSMGASTTILAMSKDLRIQAAILNASFASARQAISERAQALYGYASYPFLPVSFWLYGIRGQLKLSHTNAEDVVGTLKRPLLFIHGLEDKVVLPHHSKHLFKLAKEPKQLWLLPKGKHVNAWQVDRKQAEARVVQFFKTFLGTSQPTTRKTP